MKTRVFSSLLQSYSIEDQGKITTLFDRLTLNLKKDIYALTGSLALRYGLISHGLSTSHTPLNDVDLVINNIHDVHPSVTNDFLINHYHLPKSDADTLFIQLVDPVSCLRVDIFPFHKSSRSTWIDTNALPILSMEDLFVQIISITQSIFQGKFVSPKHFDNMNMLMPLVHMNTANQIWNEIMLKRYSYSLAEAIDKAQTALKNHSELIKTIAYRADEDFICSKCNHVRDFPIAPAKKVIEVLGYI